jgi:hypothetical protein
MIVAGRSGVVAEAPNGRVVVTTGGTISAGAISGIGIDVVSGEGTGADNDGFLVEIGHDVASDHGRALRIESDDGGSIAIAAGASLTGVGPVIDIVTDTSTMTTIANAGLISSNSSAPGSHNDRAIRLDGGHVVVDNAGTIVGRLDFADARTATVNNTSPFSWHTAGTSSFTSRADVLNNGPAGLIATNANGVGTSFAFGGGSDVFNNSGLLAVGDGTDAKLTLSNLETLNNSGGIILGWNGNLLSPGTDGAHNDQLLASGTAFVGSGASALLVDSFLGSGNRSDRLVAGALSGSTQVLVKDTNAGGPGAFNSILVVDGTSSTATAFSLAGGNIDKGLVEYTLRRTGTDWFLVGIPSAAGISMAGMGLAWLDNWNSAVSSFAASGAGGMDFAERRLMGAQELASDDGALWIRGLASHDSRDGMRSFTGLGGIAFGADLVTRGSDGSALTIGLTGSYNAPRLESRFGLATAQSEVWEVGLHVSDGRGFVDFSMKTNVMAGGFHTPEEHSFAAPLEGKSTGAQIQAGYRMESGRVFIEPMATLSYAGTAMSDVEILGGSVAYDDISSLRGRLAARMGGEWQLGETVLRPFLMAGLTQELGGSNRVTLHSGGTSFTLDDASRRTMGEFGGGLDLVMRDGVSAYVRGEHFTGSATEQSALRAGLRWSFGGGR